MALATSKESDGAGSSSPPIDEIPPLPGRKPIQFQCKLTERGDLTRPPFVIIPVLGIGTKALNLGGPGAEPPALTPTTNPEYPRNLGLIYRPNAGHDCAAASYVLLLFRVRPPWLY